MIDGHRATVHVDDQVRRPSVPLHSRAPVCIPPRTIAPVLVSSPVSSLSVYFIPTSLFVEQSHLFAAQQVVCIRQADRGEMRVRTPLVKIAV